MLLLRRSTSIQVRRLCSSLWPCFHCINSTANSTRRTCRCRPRYDRCCSHNPSKANCRSFPSAAPIRCAIGGSRRHYLSERLANEGATRVGRLGCSGIDGTRGCVDRRSGQGKIRSGVYAPYGGGLILNRRRRIKNWNQGPL